MRFSDMAISKQCANYNAKFFSGKRLTESNKMLG